MDAEGLVKLLVEALKQTNLQRAADQSNDVNYQIMPDFNKSIRDFNGKENDCEARDWLCSVNAVADLNRWSDAFRLECVRFHLVGAAKSWYTSLRVSSWIEFKSEFEKTFTSPLDTADRWKLLLERKQRKGEDIIDYFFEKLRMCNDLNLRFDEIKTQIIDGITSREMKQFLLCRTHACTNEVVRDIKHYSQLMGNTSSDPASGKRTIVEYRSYSAVPVKCSICKGGHKDEFCTQGKLKDEIKCFRCFAPGHFKSECKVQIKCIRCGKPGHMIKNCPETKTDFRPSTSTSKNEAAFKTACVNSSEGPSKDLKYYQTAKLNGNEMKAYIDNGSKCVMIRESYANEFNIQYEKSSDTICGFGNGKISSLGVFEASLQVDQAEAKVKVHVVPDKFLQIPLLIGQPFTENEYITIVKRGNNIRVFEERQIEDEECFKDLVVPPLPKQEVKLWAKEETVIPAGYIGFITACADDMAKKSDIFINGGTNRGGSIIPSCVVSMSDEINIPVVNLSSSEIVFEKGVTLTRGKPCFEEVLVTDVEDPETCEHRPSNTLKKINMEIECDLASIRDEDLLRKMWQQSEDFGRKKEIRSHLYKLRESRLREFYSTGGPGGEIMSNKATDLHFGKTPLTPSHGDSLVDQSFQSLKSKEIRDSLSPTHEVKFRNSGGIGGGVLVPDTTGWDVKTSSEVSPDGRAFRTETMAKTDGVEKLPGGHAEFAGRNEHKSSASHQGDDKNYVKKAAESSKTHLQEKVVIGDENSGRTEVKSSSMTSSSKVTSSSSQQVFTSEDPGFDMQPRRLTQHHDQHQNMLQEANNSSNTVHSERQQYSRNERNERQETVRNTREESQKYVDMDKASPEYQQHVQYLMSQPGAIISNTVEYPKPGVKMITTVKKLPDGTTVKTKRYETEASAAGSDNTSISQTVKQQQQQRTTSSTSSTQKSTEKRIQDSEDVFARLARTRDSNVPSNASPRRAPESPSTDDIHTRLQQSRNVNDQKFSDSIDQRSTQILRDNNQPQHPGGRNAPMTRRPSDLVDNVEMISTTNKTVKKDLSQSVRSEKITSSDFIQNERDRYIHDQDRPSRPGPDGYPETLVPTTPNRHGRPSQPGDDHPPNGYNATEVIKQSSSTKSSAKFSESRRYSTETVESYQDSLIDNQDHTIRGYPSNRRPIDEPSRRSPSGGRPDFSTHGFPSVRSDKPTQQYSSDSPRPQDDYTTERVHTDRDDSTTTTRSNYSTNETRRHVTKEDFSTHGFPSVRAGTPTRDSPRRPLGTEPSPGESPKRPSGQEPKSSARPGQRPQDDYTTSTERVHTIHTDRPRPGDDSTTTTRSNYSTNETRHHVTKEDFSTHGFPSVRSGTPTSDSPRRPLGSEPSPGESPKRPSGQEPPSHQYRNPPSDGFSTHGFPSVKTDSLTNDSPRRPSSGPEPTHQGRRPTTEDFSTHGFPSVKPGRSTPTQSSPRYETPNRVDREDTVSVTSDRSNSVIYEKKIDAAHAAFARSLRCASPVESPRRDSTSDRHTPRSSVGSIRNSYSPSKSRDGRSPSRDSVTNSESSRISSGTVTKTQRPTEVRRISHPKSPIGKSSPSHVSNEMIDLTLTRKITAKPSPDKASSKPTPVEEQPIVAEPILRKKILGATQDFLASESVIEKPILKSQPYYQLGQSDATLPSSYSKYRQQRGSTPNTSRRLNTTNTEEEVNTLLDTATKHITTPSLKTTPRFAKTQDHPKTKQQPDTLSSKKPLTKPEGYITLNEANQISEKQNLTTNKHVSYPNYIPSGPKADRSPSDIRPAPQSTTPHNIAPKSTKDKVKSPSTTTSSPSPRSTSPLKVDNSTSRFTKTVNRDTNTTTKTKRHPEQEPESDREPLHEPEDLDEGYVPDRKGRRRPNSQRPTSDDEGFEPDSPRAGSPTSDFEYRRPEQVETFDEEDSVVKKTRRTDKKIVTNDFLETERNVPKSRGPEEPVDGPRNTEERPTRPDREGRKPSNLVGKPTEPHDRRQPEDQEPKRTLRRPNEEDTDHKSSPKDRKPSQLTDEPRYYEPDQGRKPYNLVGKPTEPQDHTQPEDQEPGRPLRRPKEEDTDESTPKDRKPSQLTDEPRFNEPDQGRKPYNLAGKPTEPQDHTQPEDQEPRRPLRRPKEEDTDHKSAPKDRKPSQLTDEPRNYEPDQPKETTRKPSYPKEPLGADSKPSRPLETSRPKGAKPPLERSETFEERCRQILGMDSETVVDRTKKTQEFIETERTTVDSTRRPSDRSPSPVKKQPSDNVKIEDCDDEDDVETRRKYPSKTTITTTDTTRGQPREKSPLKPGEDRPTDRYPDSRLPKHTAPSEFGVTVLTTTITDERSLSPERRSPKKSQPDDVRPRDRSPSERPGKIDEATTIRKTTKIVDEIDERSNYSKPGSRPKDQSPQSNQPSEKSPTSRRTPSPQKKQPRDTVSIEDCEDEEYTNKTTDVEKTTWKETRDKSPNDKKPMSQSPGRKLPKETTNEINERLTTERTTKTTDDRSPSPKRKSPKQDDDYPRDRSPFEQPETDEEISTFRKTTKIVDEIDERKTHSKPGSLPKDQYPGESRPTGKSPEDDSDTEDRSPSGKRTFITTRETTFDVETSNDKSPTRPSIRGTSPSDKSPRKKSPVRASSPTDETVITTTTTTHSVRGTSPVEKLPRDRSPTKAPVRGTSPSDKSPKKKSPVRGSSPTDETLTTITTHSTTTDGVHEDRYPSYTPKGSPYDHSPYDKPRPKPETTDKEEVTIDISKKTKKTTTEEIHDDIFETKRPRERQPDTRDGSFFSQPRDQSPSEREPTTSRPKGDDLPREEKPTIEEIECVTTKQTSKIISDTITAGGPRPKEQPRDRSPSKKPTTEDTNQKSRPRTHPREDFPVDDLTRPSSKTTTETRRVDKTSVINDFLDTERRTHGPKRPEEDKPSQPREKSPTRKPKGPTVSDLEESTVVKTTRTTKDTKVTNEVDELSPSSRPRDRSPTEKSPTRKPKGPTVSELEESTVVKTTRTTKDTKVTNEVDELFPSSSPRDRSPTEKPIRSPRIVTTETTTEYGITSRPRSESPMEEPKKPVDSNVIDETFIRKTTSEKIKKDARITIDLDDYTEKPSRRPRPTGNNDQPRDKLPQKSKPSDRSPSPRSRYPKGQEPLGTNGTPRSVSPIQKPRLTDSTDEETNLVTTSKITNKITKTREDVEDVDFEDRPRGKSPEKPKGSRPTEQLPREPTDSDYEETLVKRRNKTTRNETTFEEKTDRSPRYYPEDKPREKSPSSKPRAQKPTEDTDDEYQKRPFGKSKPRDSSPFEEPRKPIIGEEVIIQTTSIRTSTPEDRYPKGPRGISPAEKPGPKDSPRETSPVLKSRRPGLVDETFVEETTIESTTITDRIQKSPRQLSPSEKPGPRDYPRGKSPNDDSRKPGYNDNVVQQITTETTIIKDHPSPREPSPSEKPEPRNYPRDRSPNEKPLKSRYDEIVTEKTTTESTLVKDRLTKSPRERSPSDKPGTRNSPRDRSPEDKPRKPRYDESVVEKVTTESTIVKEHLAKTPRERSPSDKPGFRNSPRDRSPEDSSYLGFRGLKPKYDDTVVEKISTKPTTIRDHSLNSPKSPRRSSPSEKYGPRDSPRDISPNEKPRKPRYDEVVVEKLTTESTIVKDRLTKSPRGSSPTEKPRTRDHPRDRSPTDKQRKPTVGDQVRPRGASPTKKPESRRPSDEKTDETYLTETIRERKTIEETIIDECCPEHQPREKSPLGKPKGSKPVGNTSVVKRPSKTTPVNDNLSKTPRGPSPTKSSPQERSPTQKSPLTKGSPRTTSPAEKPTKRQPIVSEYGKSVTSKFNKDIKTSEKIIVKEHPRRKSPSDKPRRNRPTSDDDTDDETTETIIAVYTIDGETVEDRPQNLSPKKSPQKPSDSTPKKPQTNGHSNHPRGISPTEKPKQRQPTDEEIEELFISSSRVTKNRETVEKTTLDQPRDKSPLSVKPRGRQPTDESIDTTVIQKTRRTNRNEISLEETEYQFPEDRPSHRSPSGGSPHRAYPREPSPTSEETILYTTEVRTKIGGSPRDRSPTEKPRERYPSGKPEPRSYPRDKSPTDKPGPRTYPRDKSPSDKPNRSRPGYLEETSNKTTNVRQIVQQTDSEKQYPKGRPVSQSPAEKPSTVRRPSKLSTTTTTTTTRNRSSIDEQRPKTQPSTRDKLPTKTMPLSSPRTQPTVDRRVPAELPSPNRKPKSTFGVTTKTTTSTVTKSPVALRPKATTESAKKPLKFPLESRPGARPTERKTQSISPDSSPSRAGSDFENDSQKSPSPTRSVKLEDITTTVSTAKKITVASDKSDSTVRHVTTAKIQITPPSSPTKVIGTPEVKVTLSPKKPSSRVPTPKLYSKAETRTTTTRKITSKINKDGIIPTDSEDRESEVPSDIEEVDTPMQPKPSTRKLPVTERKESAPVHRVTKINKDVQMSRSTSENIIKTPITKRPSRHEPLEPQREVPSSRPTTGDRSSPKSERRPSKHLSTKTINLTTFDKIINSEDMENVVIDIQHAKSSREPSPNKIVPTPVSVDTYTGKPRYPDVVQEPEDEPKKKPVVKNIPIFEEETNDYVRCQITEVNEERLENTVRARTTKFIEKEASPQRQAPRIVTGDNVDSECLLSVHDKVSKFISTAEEVSKPKTSAPFRRDLPEQDMPEDDECLLTVDEKVSKFLKTADSVTKEVVTSKPRRVERPSIEDLDEDLKTDECVLSVSEKVNKFTTKAEKLAPSAPQRSPELVARIERQISRASDAEPESPESEDSPASVRKFKPSSPLTERTDKKYTERQIDILSRPSVWEKKTKPDVKLDDIISAKPEDEVPQKSKPLKSTDSVSKRKELFESKVSTNKTTVGPTRPSNSPSDRRPSDVSDSRYPNEFTPRYVDGYPQQEPDDDVHEDVYGSSKTRRVYESSNHETTTVIRSPERSPTRKTPQPENRPSTQTTRKSPRPTEEKNPSRRYSEDHSPKYPTRDQSSTDRYTTYESSENTNRRRSSTQEYSDHKTSYNGVPRSPLKKQPSEEPEDFSTLSTRRDESTTHYTTRTVPHSPKDSPLTPTSFLDDDEEHDHSPARSTSTVSSHKHTSSTHRTTSTSKRVIEDSTTRRPRRPSGNEPATPTTPGSRTPRTRVVPETVAARRNIFEKTPGNVSPLPTGRRPSYMEPTKSSLEHRKDSLEVTKTNFSRKSSVDEEPYEPSPRASVKFGVGLKHKEEPKPKRKLSSSDIPNIEDVFELELLEEMLNVVSSYEQRRRIRAQIRVVKKLLETKTKEEVSSMTRITTIRKTSASSVRESPTPKKEAPVRLTEKYQLTDDDIDSESFVKSHHVEEREEIIRERSISPQSRTSRVVTKVTEVRKIAEPSTPTNKRTPLKKDEPKDSKPIWATKNILKKPSENEKVTRALSAKKTTSTSSSSTSRTQQQTSRQRVAIDDDCVTSSYGIGPTDEDGRPLFGIRALKKKTNTTSTNSTVQPSETTKVTGTVITEKYYSENGAEPVGERKVTVYSTNPEELVDLENQYDRRDSETVKREKLSKDGLTTVTKVQKIGKYSPGEIPSLTDDTEFTKTSSKMVRRGSVKEMSEKFIRKESSSSVTEKSSGYPKAGLILRTRRNSGATADTADQYEARAKSTEYDYDSEENVEIRTSRKHSKVVTESDDETEIRRKVNTRSFLNSAGSKVTGVDDVLERMRNADNVEVDGDTIEDREARSLLNKFLGASVLMSGMESMIPQMELRKTTTSGADNKQEVKTTRVTKTIKSGTTGGSSSSPVARETCDFEEIWDEEILKQLLEKSTSYEERRSIRARLRQLMADREASAESKASAKAKLNETKVKTSTQVAEDEESSGSEYEEIIEEYTASEDDDDQDEETSKTTTTSTTTVIAADKKKAIIKEEPKTKEIKKTTIIKKEEPKSSESKKTVVVETTTVVEEIVDNDDDDSASSHVEETKTKEDSKINANNDDSDSVSDSKGQSTTTTEKTETKKEDGGVVTTTTKVTTRTITGAPKPVSPFAKFQQLDKQNSLQSPKSPNTPTTPGGSSTTPIFRFTDPALNARAATFKEQLLQWCQSKTQEYENVQITNFSASWTDGLAFCALIHHFLPDAFDYSKLTPKQRRYNFELAFRVADEKAGIAPLLDVEDMVVMKRPDWKCVFTYVQSIYRRFRNCQ